MTSYVLTVTCKSTRGIVAAISSYLADKGCNIIDSSQFDDLDTGKFFTRVLHFGRGGNACRAEKGFSRSPRSSAWTPKSTTASAA